MAATPHGGSQVWRTCLRSARCRPGSRPQHLDAAGELFAKRGAKLYLDHVIAKKQILKA